MRRTTTLLAMIMAVLMLTTVFAGCVYRPVESAPAESAPAESAAPSPAESEAVQDEAQQLSLATEDSLLVRSGEETITVSLQEGTLTEDVESKPEAVTIGYGIGETSAKSVKRQDDTTLSVTFEIGKNDDQILESWGTKEPAYVLVGADVIQEGISAYCNVNLTYPAAKVKEPAPRGAERLTVTIETENTALADRVSAEDLRLSDGFSGMNIDKVERRSDTVLAVSISGAMPEADGSGVPYTEGSVVLDENATTAGVSLCAEAALATPAAYWGDYPRIGSDGASLKLRISLENCQWTEPLALDQLSLQGDADGLALTGMEKIDDTNIDVTMEVTDDEEREIDVLSVHIGRDATTAGQELGVDFDFSSQMITGDITDMEIDGDKAVLSIHVTATGYTFTSVPQAKDIVLGESFANGTVAEVQKASDTELTMKVTAPTGNMDGDYVGMGIIQLPESCIQKTDGVLEEYETLVCVPILIEEKAESPVSSQAPQQTAMLSLSAVSAEPLAVNVDGMISSAVNSLCESAKEGLVGLAKNTGMSILKNGILPLLGITIDDRSEELKKLEELSDKLDNMSVQIDRVEQSIKKLIDATESSAFKQQMRDVQTSVLTLKPRIAGYQGGLSAILELTPGTDEYNKELGILAEDINKAQGIDFHSATYALGEKILTDAAGTSDGALKSHYDRVMTQYNWEQQTYDERERFYLYTVGTYYQAVIFDKLALQYTIETATSSVAKKTAETRLNELEIQAGKVSKEAEKYQVKRLDAKYDRNLRANVILEKNIQTVTYNNSNMLVSDADAFSLIQHKLDKGPSKWGRNISMEGEAVFHIDSSNLLTEAQANTIMKYSKQKTLLEELKSAGFQVSGSASQVLLGDVKIYKGFIRTGTSPTRYCYGIYYRLFDNKINEQRIRYFCLNSNTKTQDYFNIKAYRYTGSRYEENKSADGAQVIVVKDDKSLYVS